MIVDLNKVSQISDIAIKVVKGNANTFGNFFWNIFNNFVKLSKFLEVLKHVDVTLLYKKVKKDIKGNFRPVSILPNLSKIFKKCMFKQMSQFFENIFLKYQYGFRKGFSTQQCFLAVRKMEKVC